MDAAIAAGRGVNGFVKDGIILNSPNISTNAHVPSRTNTTNNGVPLIPLSILIRMNRTATRMNSKLSKMRAGTLGIT